MRSAALLALAALALAACSDSRPPSEPPEGWVTEGDDQWWVPGTDTSAAFRDLSTLETMGVAREDDEFVRWFQEQMTDLYRTSPEVVDSVFEAEFLPRIQEGVPAGDDYATAASGLVNEVKRDFFQRYNAARYSPPAEPQAIPADLADVGGQVTVQVYVNENKEPVAVELLEGTGTELDQIAMRRALESTFTDAWVRESAGRTAGVNIPNWVRITSSYGG